MSKTVGTSTSIIGGGLTIAGDGDDGRDDDGDFGDGDGEDDAK